MSNNQTAGNIWTECSLVGFVIGLVFFLNTVCLLIVYVILSRKIASHTCMACVKSIDLDQNKPPSPTAQIRPLIEDAESASDDSDDNQESIASSSNVNYTTVNFNDQKGSGEYQNVFAKYDYVNVEPVKDIRCKRKKALLNMAGSVEYSDVCLTAADNKYKFPHHTNS